MGLRHASSGEVVDLDAWGSDLPEGKSKAIVKTDRMELIRIDLPSGREIPDHKAPGYITVQCIKGSIDFSCHGTTRQLKKGQLLFLEPDESHSLKSREDAAILLTVFRG